MSSSPEGVVRRTDVVRVAARPDLRSGVWTRLGDGSVLGDDVTEAALGALAERTSDAARAQGYAVGWAEGRRAAMAAAAELAEQAEQRAHAVAVRREAEHGAAVDALLSAAEALRAATAQVCAQVADAATDLAFEVTRELVGHELAVSADPGADVVRRVLAVLPTAGPAQVRLHPSVVAATSELAAHGVAVVADPTLAPADAVVETDSAAIDLRVVTALQRLREALR